MVQVWFCLQPFGVRPLPACSVSSPKLVPAVLALSSQWICNRRLLGYLASVGFQPVKVRVGLGAVAACSVSRQQAVVAWSPSHRPAQ